MFLYKSWFFVLKEEIYRLEAGTDSDQKLKRMAELQSSVVADPTSKHQIQVNIVMAMMMMMRGLKKLTSIAVTAIVWIRDIFDTEVFSSGCLSNFKTSDTGEDSDGDDDDEMVKEMNSNCRHSFYMN